MAKCSSLIVIRLSQVCRGICILNEYVIVILIKALVSLPEANLEEQWLSKPEVTIATS